MKVSRGMGCIRPELKRLRRQTAFTDGGEVRSDSKTDAGKSTARKFADPLLQAYASQQRAKQIIKNKLVPVNVRQYISHLLGDVSPITEAQFTPEDLETIRRAIEKRGGGAAGSIGYGDYGAGLSGFGTSTTKNDGPLDMLYKSYTDPAFRMETTLGAAAYRRLPDGTYVVEDRYNFNAPSRQLVTKMVKERGVLPLLNEAYKSNGLAGVLNAVGNIYGSTEDEPGTPVSVRIPPAAKIK